MPVGWTTISTLKKRLEAYQNVSIITGAKVTRVLTDMTHWDGEPGVIGVEYEPVVTGGDQKPEMIPLMADAVILTTGEGRE